MDLIETYPINPDIPTIMESTSHFVKTGQFERLNDSSIGGSGLYVAHLTSEGNHKPPPMLTPDQLREHIVQNPPTPGLGMKFGIHRELYPPDDHKMLGSYYDWIARNNGLL